MITILQEHEVSARKRDQLIDYESYLIEAEELSEYIPEATQRLGDKDWVASKDAATLDRLTKGRANWALDLLTLSYSAGTNMDELRVFYPEVLNFFEEFSLFLAAFNQTREGTKVTAPCFYLQDVDFERANRLLTFAILLGWPQYVPRVMAVIDYNNPLNDAMLERISGALVRGRPPTSMECTRHLPYYKTLRIFAAPGEARSELMQEYLEDWYEASRRESYYDSHDRGVPFLGYWSWEAAAITALLRIDDRPYRKANFYPGDLTDFYHTLSSAKAFEIGETYPEELRAKAGEPCPFSGTWQSIGIPTVDLELTLGEPMPNMESPYGLTVWRLSRI